MAIRYSTQRRGVTPGNLSSFRRAAPERLGEVALGEGATLDEAVPLPDGDRLPQGPGARGEVVVCAARLELGEPAQGDPEVVQRDAAGDLPLRRAPREGLGEEGQGLFELFCRRPEVGEGGGEIVLR